MNVFRYINSIWYGFGALLMISHIVLIVALSYSPSSEIKRLKEEIRRIKYECFFRVEEDHD